MIKIQIVMQLIDDWGFEPHDKGNLEKSWIQQPNQLDNAVIILRIKKN